jgi:hypothetical protein
MYYLQKALGKYSTYGLAFKGLGFLQGYTILGQELPPSLENASQERI